MAKTYESYKDSGSTWIGQIPSGWELGNFRYYGEFTKGKLPSSTNVEAKGLPIIGASEMLGKECRTFTEETNVPLCKPDDILILWDGANAGIISSHHTGVVSSTAVKYSCLNPDVNKNYLFYLLKSVEPFFKEEVNGTTIPHMNMKYINEVPLLIPSSKEQQSIASFLNTKCGEIDSLISLQEEMISELQAYKQSVITEAVTKGLDPNAKMKDSGVEWIGEIPENWKVSKVGLQYNVILGKMLCPKQLNDDYTLEKYYCAANVHFNGIEGELKKMWFSSLDKETYLTKKGDLLVVEGGAGAGGCAIVNDDESPVYIQNSIMIVRPKLINDVRYLRYQIEQFVKRGYIDVVCNKATIPHFTKDKVSNMQIPLPSFEVQQQIANYLDDKTSQIDSLISLKQQKIDELKSYKKSIIYEYVTGKKRV